jgi:hypothetical protein
MGSSVKALMIFLGVPIDIQIHLPHGLVKLEARISTLEVFEQLEPRQVNLQK